MEFDMTLKIQVDKYFALPGSSCVIEPVFNRYALDTGRFVEVGLFTGMTLAQVREECAETKIAVMTFEEFDAQRNAPYLSADPQEISETQYYEALDALPPLHRRQGTFQMSELITGDITEAYVYLHGRYWKIPVLLGTLPDVMFRRIEAYLAKTSAPATQRSEARQ
jgi:hypothetical protein